MTALNDANLDLILRQSDWGIGGIAVRITPAPDAVALRGFWVGLTLYRWASPAYRQWFNAALDSIARRRPWSIYAQSVIQTKHAMLRAPGDYPFCLTQQQWQEHCQMLFGGQVDSADYTPPSVIRDTVGYILSAIGTLAVGAGVTLLVPEEALAGTAIAALGGPAITKSIAVAAGSALLQHVIPTTNPIDDIDKVRTWHRYQFESQRRKLR
ncbi:hypothetical protein HN018_08510 [Lichenicola cladoniae]|uniref:Uncharacterized protein n=1 Tax=Lichenicola cladoniae TaxID=1484109 RepID=A0A6M8HNZ9_9PROT|nr:hypothetical protein [Lichenicola cladoniae]NPD68429.1 hypothetical protein [Acetobacteraceae bacterium]QKE90088.1 hypothetical protein HN018_08510 [Lichenicola cladoniae]